MNSKERVLTAFGRGEPDRVPINYMANPAIDGRLKEHFGLSADDGEGLLEALGVDFRGVGAPYVGERLHAEVPDRRVDGMWGIHVRRIEHGSGEYWDYCDFPLKDADLEAIENWPMPSPDDFDYSHIAARCMQMKDYCVCAGNMGTCDIINSTGMIRSMEQVLIDLATDDPACLRFIDRKIECTLEVIARTLETLQAGPGEEHEPK